jgi:four helix bundle protein
MKDKPHKKLDLWKKAVDLSVLIYQMTGKFPSQEMYGLVSQMRRAVVSISCNIAEGAARQTKKEFIQFLHMARGSLSELDTQLEISIRLGYIKSEEITDVLKIAMAVDMMLSGLIRSLRLKEHAV